MIYHDRAMYVTAWRVLRQLSHDRRTLILIFVVPCLLLTLLRWLYSNNLAIFNHIAPALLGVFPFVIMFITTSITMLRERRQGTLERLMTMPVGKSDIVLGYMIAFGVLAIIQALAASALLLFGLGVDVAGPRWFLVLVALADALLGTALGIFVSSFARTEFEAVQFMPALILPQILIGGLLVPLDQMPDALAWVARVLPMTYAIDALNQVARYENLPLEAWCDLWFVAGFALVALLLATLTLRRQSKH